MHKYSLVPPCLLGLAAVLLTVGSGTAVAEDAVIGQTFAKAKVVLRHQGFKVDVASTVGDQVTWNDCLVTNAIPAPKVNGYGKSAGAKMNVSLNCYADVSSALSPGFSLQSPEGQKLYQAASAEQ